MPPFMFTVIATMNSVMLQKLTFHVSMNGDPNRQSESQLKDHLAIIFWSWAAIIQFRLIKSLREAVREVCSPSFSRKLSTSTLSAHSDSNTRWQLVTRDTRVKHSKNDGAGWPRYPKWRCRTVIHIEVSRLIRTACHFVLRPQYTTRPPRKPPL